MQRDPRAFLWDVREAALAIQSFTSGMDAMAYVGSELVQAAVERKFEVIAHGRGRCVHHPSPYPVRGKAIEVVTPKACRCDR